jgi:DNA-binding NtrC family response regulator
VEDDPAVLRSFGRLLSGAGYHLLASQSADEAVAIARSHSGPLHLLLCDLTVPGGHGGAHALRIVEQRPRLPVLLITGHPVAHVQSAYPALAGWPLLQKPVPPPLLLQTVRRVLGLGQARDTERTPRKA